MSELLDAALNQLEIGGWVMYPLVMVCLWMWYLIVKKVLDMYVYTKGWRPVSECIKSAKEGELVGAPWQQKILEGFMAERTDDGGMNDEILESLKLGQMTFIKSAVGTIALLASISPLLGLLGTVGGMIKTFDVIAVFGTGNAKALAGGISEALLTTQTGLVVAVPGLFVATFLARRANGLLDRMQRFCLRISRSSLSAN